MAEQATCACVCEVLPVPKSDWAASASADVVGAGRLVHRRTGGGGDSGGHWASVRRRDERTCPRPRRCASDTSLNHVTL